MTDIKTGKAHVMSADVAESGLLSIRKTVPEHLAHAFAVVACIGALVLVLRLLNAIWTTGNNCLTNDYQYLIPVVDGLLRTSINWSEVMNECFQNSHFLLLPTLGFCINALLFEWNVRVDCTVGVLLAVLRCLLFTDCLTMGMRSRACRWIVFSVVFALTFGSTALSCFTFGQASLTGGIGMLGFALGLWAVSKHATTTKGDVLTLLGGLVVALCAGYWIPAWASFAAVLIAKRVRKLRSWAVIVAGAGVSAIPTLVHLGMKATDAPQLVSVFNLSFLVNTLGRCFANRIGVTSEPLLLSQIAGWLCIAAVFAFLIIAPLRRSDSNFAAAVGVSTFGLLSVWFTSLFRVSVAPWYAGFAVFVWIGILTAAVLCVSGDLRENVSLKVAVVFKVFGVSLCTLCFGLYMASNLKLQDKDFWSDTRSEASESCVRNYRIAPTYCERLLFLGHIGDFGRFYKLAQTLELRQWSAFSRNQVWSLQGDFVLPTVSIYRNSTQSDAFWIQGRKLNARRSWIDPEHLNLVVKESTKVAWNVALPSNTVRASLKSRLVSDDAGMIRVRAKGREAAVLRLIAGQMVNMDLATWKGQEVELDLESETGTAVYEHPAIVVEVSASAPPSSASVPCNTDRSKFFPQTSPEDMRLPVDIEWNYSQLNPTKSQSEASATFKASGTQPKLTLSKTISVSANQYSHFVINIKVRDDLKVPRAVCVGFIVNQSKLVQRLIPLLPGSEGHGYSYELKLLDLSPTDRITGLEILPVYVRAPGDEPSVEIGEIRFARSWRGSR